MVMLHCCIRCVCQCDLRFMLLFLIENKDMYKWTGLIGLTFTLLTYAIN